jgi:Uncharacterized protein involved in propionate catabolism
MSGSRLGPVAAPSRLYGKIKVEADENLLSDYPRTWPARVRVSTGSAQHERLVTHVPGDPARPFDRAQVRDKFLSFVAPLLGAQQAQDILARCSDVLATGEFSALWQRSRMFAASRSRARPAFRCAGRSGRNVTQTIASP